MKQWKRLAALSSAIVMAAATLTYFPNDTLQNIRLEIWLFRYKCGLKLA